MAREHSEAAETARCLDEALAGTFPASDPPSMTSPTAATPSADLVVEAANGPLRVYRVVEAGQASDPFAPTTSGGRWSPPGQGPACTCRCRRRARCSNTSRTATARPEG